eukprot:CAMPEP_0114254480 /NCGR_PEP_ID=MMETSP0058-20121206/17000_1 /TAXON_ID=36894 /ORGANISM="Pyramimonas parkeae, CCMP726" /LENGTH=290 /DNA_ID=CAMNT_0001368699 /DNA_START=582 /DNA_END=1454 /DNA_ORIENTATION=-
MIAQDRSVEQSRISDALRKSILFGSENVPQVVSKKRMIESDKKLVRRLSTRLDSLKQIQVDMKQQQVHEVKQRVNSQWKDTSKYNTRRNSTLEPCPSSAGSGRAWDVRRTPSVSRPGPKFERSATQVAIEIADYYDRESSVGSLDSLDASTESLGCRLSSLKLKMEVMMDDGNCQFRSCAFHLYGHQKHHQVVRDKAVRYMRDNSQMFKLYFATEKDWEQYIANMSMNRTWGDELTLRAVTDSFGTVVHVVQSTEENWYLVYEPDIKQTHKQVFLTYLSPVHYNALLPAK